MSFAQEGSWNSTSLSANVASSTISATVNGTGFELIVFVVTVDTSNSCTGVTLSAHANFNPGAIYTGTSAAGVINCVVWGIWTGGSGTPSFTLTYTGGNTGANGGKLATGVFTGANANIIASPGPSASGTGTSGTSSVVLNGVSAGSLVVAVSSNASAKTYTAGAGYSLIFNTSSWGGNITGYEQTTGLSEPGGNPTVAMTLTSSTWNMLAVAFPSSTPAIVQSVQSSVASASSTIVATLSNGSTAGNALFLCAPIKTSTNSAVLSITDDKSNTWHTAAQTAYVAQSSLFGTSAIFYCLNPTAGTKAVTLNTSTGTLSGSTTAIETIPVSLADQIGTLALTTGSSAAVTSTATDSGANDYVFACFQEQGTTTNDGPSVSAGYTVITKTVDGTTNCNMVAFRANSTVLQDSSTFSWTGGSAANTAAIASFFSPLTPFLYRRPSVIALDDIIYY